MPQDIKVAPVGAGVVRCTKGKSYSGSIRLEVMLPSERDESGYMPAESITLWGTESLRQLRDFLNEVLEEDGDHVDVRV